MENKKNVFDYVGQVLMVFGLTITCLIVFVAIFGENAREYSSIFKLGDAGLSEGTMLQFLLTSVLIVTYKFLFLQIW